MATATAAAITPPSGWVTVTKRGKTKIRPAVLPSPLVALSLHPRTWVLKLWNTAQTLGWIFVAGYIGMLMASALYYGFFETFPFMTHAWHAFVPSDYWRHLFRAVMEGVFAGSGAALVVYNHYKPYSAVPGRFNQYLLDHNAATCYDDDPLSGRQVAALLRWVPQFLLPGGLVGIGVVALFHYHVLNSHIVTRAMMDYTNGLPAATTFWGFALVGLAAKIVGLFAQHFWGRLPLMGVYDDIQLYIVELVIAYGKAFKVFMPPTWQARYNEVRANSLLGTKRPSLRMKIGLGLLVFVGISMTVAGAYVQFVLAKRG
ncbi:MAG: hypothetical protein ACQR33_00510 [Candidatus Saccharibacteria bacterium]